MRRAFATERLVVLGERLIADGGLVEFVDRVWLYGSYARGALEVGDIDRSV